MDRRVAVNEIKREESRNIEASKLLRDVQLTKLTIWTDALKANRKVAKRNQKDIWLWQIYDANRLKERIISDHWSRESLATLWAARAIRKIAPNMLAMRHEAELRDWDRGDLLEPATPENIALHRKVKLSVLSRYAAGEQKFYSIPAVAFRRRVHARMLG